MNKTYAVPPQAPLNHGNTVAAWVLTIGVVLGAVLAAIGFAMSMTLMYVGVGILVISVIISVVLRFAGLGQLKRS